jgi:hypothetical protein
MKDKNQYLPTKVQVVLAVSPEQVDLNIKTNLKQIPNWFGDLFYPNGYEAIIVSAGPSMEKYVEELNLKERMEKPDRTFVVFCVKHALPRLMAMGIEPDFCVILDGRPIDEDSTHGVNRVSLFEKIPDRTVFLIASMSNPGYANYLMTNGARVLGWHTAVDGIKKFQEQGIIREVVISGGTSSGTRCIGIANAMGIRDMTLVGFDSCIHDPTPEQLTMKDSKGRTKYLPIDLPVKNPLNFISDEEKYLIDIVTKGFENRGLVYQSTLSKRFYSTGELIAQAQDFESILTNTMFDIKFKVLDDGLVNHMHNNLPNVSKRSYDFVSYIRSLCPRKNPSQMPKKDVVLGSPRQQTHQLDLSELPPGVV